VAKSELGPSSRRSRSSNCKMDACTETSSAEVISPAISIAMKSH
jgi:hypothetical protein